MKNIQFIINSEAYDFLRTDENLKDGLIFLTFGGSHAYGTATPTSDIDIRGCCFNSKASLIGLNRFEQVVDEATDTTIYGFNKLINLLLACNPNTIELLGCKPEHYLLFSPVAQALLDNRKMFLSKRAIMSFGGYAGAQLRRLQNALARDAYPQAEKEHHILRSIRSAMTHFEDKYRKLPEGAIRLSIGDAVQEDLDAEIFVDVSLTHYPLRDYKNIWAEMHNIVKDYDKLNKRNNKKDDVHINKHAMHLIRLYLMCLDILEKEEIITYRANDVALLMRIRNGEFQKADGTFHEAFFDMVTDYEKRLAYAAENTGLPDRPDDKRIEAFVMSVNESVIRGDY